MLLQKYDLLTTQINLMRSEQAQPIDAQTSLLARFLNSVGLPVERLPGIQEQKIDLAQTPMQYYTPRKYADFQSPVPIIPPLPETDKKSQDYNPMPVSRSKRSPWKFFEAKPTPVIVRGMQQSTAWEQPPETYEKPPELAYSQIAGNTASVLTNPGLDSLASIQWGNALEANYGQSTAIASGQDDARSVLKMASENPQSGVPSEPEPTAEKKTADSKDSSVTGAWILHGLGLRDSAYQETGLFVVGALILGIGIFALTR